MGIVIVDAEVEEQPLQHVQSGLRRIDAKCAETEQPWQAHPFPNMGHVSPVTEVAFIFSGDGKPQPLTGIDHVTTAHPQAILVKAPIEPFHQQASVGLIALADPVQFDPRHRHAQQCGQSHGHELIDHQMRVMLELEEVGGTELALAKSQRPLESQQVELGLHARNREAGATIPDFQRPDLGLIEAQQQLFRGDGAKMGGDVGLCGQGKGDRPGDIATDAVDQGKEIAARNGERLNQVLQPAIFRQQVAEIRPDLGTAGRAIQRQWG